VAGGLITTKIIGVDRYGMNRELGISGYIKKGLQLGAFKMKESDTNNNQFERVCCVSQDANINYVAYFSPIMSC